MQQRDPQGAGPKFDSNPRPTNWQAGVLTTEQRLSPVLSIPLLMIEMRLAWFIPLGLGPIYGTQQISAASGETGRMKENWGENMAFQQKKNIAPENY